MKLDSSSSYSIWYALYFYWQTLTFLTPSIFFTKNTWDDDLTLNLFGVHMNIEKWYLKWSSFSSPHNLSFWFLFLHKMRSLMRFISQNMKNTLHLHKEFYCFAIFKDYITSCNFYLLKVLWISEQDEFAWSIIADFHIHLLYDV